MSRSLTLDERVRAACAAIAEQASRSNVVVVSHVSPMKSAVAWALGVDIGISWNCHLDHASVCRISFQGTRPVLETFNETAKSVTCRAGSGTTQQVEPTCCEVPDPT